MIMFRKLRWKNLLSTGNIFTEIALDQHQTTLIVGENGAGKSTILDALSFALFGKPFRNINKPQLINTITQKGLVVEVEFDIVSNNYKIVRGIRPNVFEVYQNGKLLNQSAEMKDYQEILEKQIIKVNHKSFCQVVVLGSATFQPFMQLPGGRRREIIEDLLDLQIFTTMNSLLKFKVQCNNEELSANSAERRLIDEKIKLIQEHLVELQQNSEQQIEEKKQRIISTEEQMGSLEIDYLQVEAQITELESGTEDQGALTKRLKKLQSLRHQIEANLSIIKKEVEFFNKNDDCPTCKQAIHSDFKCEAIKTKNVEIDEINAGLDKLVEQYNDADAKLKGIMSLNATINTLKLDQIKAKARINALTDYIVNLNEEINSVKKNQDAIDFSKVSELEAELEVAKQDTVTLLEERDILGAAATLLKDGGIKAKIVKQYVPVINKLINKYLSAMEFFVQFELDENFNETIKSRYRDEFSYASFSEGEKMRINLAILFTWRAIAKLRNSINTNLLIMDEVFDSSLDANGTEEFLKILNSLTLDTNTFIISHKTDQLAEKFDKVIRFEKHKNFSKIAA